MKPFRSIAKAYAHRHQLAAALVEAFSPWVCDLNPRVRVSSVLRVETMAR